MILGGFDGVNKYALYTYSGSCVITTTDGACQEGPEKSPIHKGIKSCEMAKWDAGGIGSHFGAPIAQDALGKRCGRPGRLETINVVNAKL